MKRETKILVVLYLLLIVALIVPIVPYPKHLYYQFHETRWLTIIEYLRTIIWNLMLDGGAVV